MEHDYLKHSYSKRISELKNLEPALCLLCTGSSSPAAALHPLKMYTCAKFIGAGAATVGVAGSRTGIRTMFGSLRLPWGAQMVKNQPALQETRVQSLGQEDPLEKGIGTHSSILAWRILWTEEPSGLQSIGLQRVGYK